MSEEKGFPLYDASGTGFGKMDNVEIQPDYKGSGSTHYTYRGEGAHFSFDVNKNGNVSGAHETVHPKK